MDIKELRDNWNELGQRDPFWAILTEPEKKGNKWVPDEFFATGRAEVDLVRQQIKTLGISTPSKRAMDFGCGVGRLTQGLAMYFDEVHGIDIASSMIDLANKYNKYPDKCNYHLNEKNDLKQFHESSFDLIYTNITLQHMEPRYSANYIKEFLRLLTRGGVLIFQMPSRPAMTPKGLVIRFVPRRILNTFRKMEMHGVDQAEVIKLLESHGGEVLDIQKDQSAGSGWISFRYTVVKK